MSRDTDAHRATVTTDSLAAAFQNFNITHVTPLEFFRFITQTEDGCEEQPAVVGGIVLPLCLSVSAPSTNDITQFSSQMADRYRALKLLI